MVFAAHGLFGTSCITALTVQSTLGVRSIHPVDAGIVAETLACLDDDLRPQGIKIGMVPDELSIEKLVGYIGNVYGIDSGGDGAGRVPVVLDPVLRSTSGHDLIYERGIGALRGDLLRLVSWITPNVSELALLAGKVVERAGDIPAACHVLQDMAQTKGRRAKLGVFAKGGHLDKPDDYLLTPDGEGHWLPGERVETQAGHGTGCALSSAFLCQLVLGQDTLTAATRAKAYVAGALRNSGRVGRGRGPINHLWTIDKVIH